MNLSTHNIIIYSKGIYIPGSAKDDSVIINLFKGLL